MGTCEYSSPVAPPPIVHSQLPVAVCISDRSAQSTDSVRDVRDSSTLGITPSPLVSSGMDQLRVVGVVRSFCFSLSLFSLVSSS